MDTFYFSLASFNIQRGREHGLQPYINYVKFFQNITITDWSNLTRLGFDPRKVEELKGAYGY